MYPGRRDGSRISATIGAAARSAPTRPSTVAEVEAGEPLIDHELEHRHFRVHEGAHGAVAPLQAQVAGVESFRRDGDVGLRREALLVSERAQCGLLAGGIRIEGEHDLA